METNVPTTCLSWTLFLLWKFDFAASQRKRKRKQKIEKERRDSLLLNGAAFLSPPLDGAASPSSFLGVVPVFSPSFRVVLLGLLLLSVVLPSSSSFGWCCFPDFPCGITFLVCSCFFCVFSKHNMFNHRKRRKVKAAPPKRREEKAAAPKKRNQHHTNEGGGESSTT